MNRKEKIEFLNRISRGVPTKEDRMIFLHDLSDEDLIERIANCYKELVKVQVYDIKNDRHFQNNLNSSLIKEMGENSCRPLIQLNNAINNKIRNQIYQYRKS